MKRLLILLIIGQLSLAAIAQKLTVEGMQTTNDLSASQFRRNDLNGQPCALVKVSLAAPDAIFEGNVISPVEYKINEYWVYMTKGSRELRIKCPNYIPLHIKFKDFGIEKGLQPLQTYDLTVLMPQIEGTVQTQDMRQVFVSSSKTNKTFSANGVSFNMIFIEGGTFQMGATSEQEKPGDSEKPMHLVKLSQYYIGETEVTQELWEAVMGSNPSKFKGAQRPVDMVSWNDCQKFIQKLNQLTGRQFRFPTEAEWEFAARGGNKSQGYQYSGSNIWEEVAWLIKGNYDVKSFLPNELGIYDMSGNVCEWCQDWFDTYRTNDPLQNPSGPDKGKVKVIRGGWQLGKSAWTSRVAFRHYNIPKHRDDSYGLRLAL